MGKSRNKAESANSRGRVAVVTSIPPTFRRGGIVFSQEPAEVKESEVGKEIFAAIVGEKMLRVELK